jgi:hypothetical protein
MILGVSFPEVADSPNVGVRAKAAISGDCI